MRERFIFRDSILGFQKDEDRWREVVGASLWEVLKGFNVLVQTDCRLLLFAFTFVTLTVAGYE